jgi:hypothetical protein
MRDLARRLNRLEQKSGTKEKRFIWVDSPEELERRRADKEKRFIWVDSPEELERRRAELQPDDIVIHWQWRDD